MRARTRVTLTLLGVAAVTAAVVCFVILPLWRHTDGDQAIIRERQEQLVKLERVARRINDLQGEINRLETALRFFENRLPAEREIDVVLREVWRIAEGKSLTARSVRTRPPESMPRCNSQPISLILEGTFQGFYEFLLALERLPRITKVREIQINKSALREGDVQVDLLMDIFFEKPK